MPTSFDLRALFDAKYGVPLNLYLLGGTAGGGPSKAEFVVARD